MAKKFHKIDPKNSNKSKFLNVLSKFQQQISKYSSIDADIVTDPEIKSQKKGTSEIQAQIKPTNDDHGTILFSEFKNT